MPLQILNVLIFFILIALIILHRDAAKFAETSHLTRLNDEESKRTYIASGITDKIHPGAKILVVLYSLFCRKCDSTNIFVDLDVDDDFLQITCRDCGRVTRIKLTDLMIHNAEERHQSSRKRKSKLRYRPEKRKHDDEEDEDESQNTLKME